jgi:hypothetical protein
MRARQVDYELRDFAPVELEIESSRATPDDDALVFEEKK